MKYELCKGMIDNYVLNQGPKTEFKYRSRV